jgi:3-oxoacyl-[acyl-carrier protein] reductase
MRRLDGKTAIITGAGSGMGRTSALTFLREGANVVGLDLVPDGLDSLVAEAGDGARLATLAGDVCERATIERAAALAVERFGSLDVYFNNAGVALSATSADEVADDRWDTILRVNLTAIHTAVTVVVPIMRTAGGGNILITSSMAGVRPRPNQTAYTAAKGGAITLGQGLAVELAPANIRVNILCPLAANTPMLARFGIGDHDEATERMKVTTPMGRLCEPEDVAEAAAFLASDAASFITGVALPIDGGRSV